ncbi:MAG: hypothetical protein HQM04_18810 [Magnetococcales bacterium]|nr:hypothetical protein [Magnetococcales bacterium]MBF0117082.1 hypothetical protein [Magnetococcales bacterium]
MGGRLLGLVVGLLMPVFVWAGERVGVVLDVTGSVQLVSELNGFEDESPLQRTNGVSVGNRLQLAEGAEVVLMHLASFKRYVVRGPNEVVVKEAGFVPKRGKAELQGAAAGGMVLAALGKGRKAVNMPEVAIGVRDVSKKVGDIILTAPQDKERLLDGEVGLRWYPFSGAEKYRVLIKELDGAVVVEQEVSGESVTLPEGVLKAAGRYSWQVLDAAGGAQSEPWRFEVVSEAERDELQRMAPASSAPISEQVLYAMVLEKMGIVGEAKRQWQRLHERDPADTFFARKAQ